ncbi:hypothetical protein RUM43_002256 [Polyplax serrata]|uniref:Uncharacterized protein n=1 Tax=Polyplax serrata TaxID=468196 RepID=A0AAN8PDK8_POLSC
MKNHSLQTVAEDSNEKITLESPNTYIVPGYPSGTGLLARPCHQGNTNSPLGRFLTSQTYHHIQPKTADGLSPGSLTCNLAPDYSPPSG